MSNLTIPIFPGASVPISLYDGNTVGWYSSDASITLVGDASVSVWGDKSGAGHNLIQATGNAMPSWSANGVLLDGVNDYMQTAAFTWNQPEMIYMVLNPVSFTSGDYVCDGRSAVLTGALLQQQSTSSEYRFYAGTTIATTTIPTTGVFSIVRLLFNGATSRIQVNSSTATVGNAGTNNMGGFTIGNRVGLGGGYGNFQFKEIILRNVVDNAINETAIYNYLSNKYLGTNLSTRKLVTFTNKYVVYQKSANEVIGDGKTVAWYDYNASTATITMADVSVSRWNDKLGSGRDLIQAVGSAQPTWTSDGILFDGVDDSLRAAFTYNNPQSIYLVAKQITWTSGDYIFDGGTAASMLFQQYNTTPGVLIRGCWATTEMTLDTFVVVRALINGGANRLIINNTTPITSANAGAAAGGFTIGGRGSTGLNSNIQVKEIILRNVVDDATNETAIYNYLATKYSIT